MAYKYNELQMSFVIQKLSCKANFKTPFFLIVNMWMCLFPVLKKSFSMSF